MSYPGAKLLHPFAALSAGVIALNDLVLRPIGPDWLVRHLSGFGVCFLGPVVLIAVYEWFALVLRLPAASGRLRWAAVLLVGAYFTALELSPAASQLHEAWLAAVFGGRFSSTADPWDLVALPSLGLAGWHLRR